MRGSGLHIARVLSERVVVHSYREFAKPDAPLRALLSYLAWPLLFPARYRDKVRFSNRGIAQEIPRALNELGYIVDVVHFSNCRTVLQTHYDLFIGHTGVNFRHLVAQLGTDTKILYFATGLYWKDLNRREAKRIYEFAERTGWLLPPDRAVVHDEEFANRTSHGIVYLGNGNAGRSFAEFPNIAGVNNAAFPITWQGWKDKDFDAGRKHFLYFAGAGNLHKGLDRIIEAFLETDLHVHVCQSIESLFGRVYDYELSSHPRIHLHHFVQQRSQMYYDLVMKCNWFISATCAEGQPGAAIECMGHGLIPILPDDANIDLGEWALRLDDCNIETVRTIVMHASRIDPTVCRDMSHGAMREIGVKYSPERFRDSFKTAVTTLLQCGPRG